MKCLILAAGYATRLYPLTENFPKPLLKVGEKTILDWLIDDIEGAGEVHSTFSFGPGVTWRNLAMTGNTAMSMLMTSRVGWLRASMPTSVIMMLQAITFLLTLIGRRKSIAWV